MYSGVTRHEGVEGADLLGPAPWVWPTGPAHQRGYGLVQVRQVIVLEVDRS
jgi:hypothetical protein